MVMIICVVVHTLCIMCDMYMRVRTCTCTYILICMRTCRSGIANDTGSGTGSIVEEIREILSSSNFSFIGVSVGFIVNLFVQSATS